MTSSLASCPNVSTARRGLFTLLILFLAFAPRALAGDFDGDGVEDAADVCSNTPAGVAVDYWGRPLFDLDGDCDVDETDFQFLMASFTGCLLPAVDSTTPGFDSDLDGVLDPIDRCDNTPAGVLVNFFGRPLGDLDMDCRVDMSEFALFQVQLTGPLDSCQEGAPCDDGLDCTVNDTCVANACVGTPVDQRCDNGLFCDGTETCALGTGCVAGTPVDCSGLTTTCALGACNETLDACVASPRNEGVACSDGLYCTINDTCRAGACTSSTPRDCSSLDGPCRDGVCNESADRCDAVPINQGQSCSDGLFCTVGEICNGGECAGGSPRDCSGLDTDCRTGVCNESTDLCVPVPINEGVACDDDLFCTVGETCRSGLCLAGDGRDCSDLDESCRIGLCDEASASCEAVPKPDDTGCHDNSVCTIADLCRDGECVGVALPDQTVCDDGNPNTPRSVCLDGECLASRLYGVNPGITYNCPAGIAFAIALLEFVDDGQTLTVLGAPVLMTGPGNIASGGSFAVSGSMGEGGCVQTYRLTGTFNATGWQGQFRAEYSMGCSCTWGIFNVQGTLK